MRAALLAAWVCGWSRAGVGATDDATSSPRAATAEQEFERSTAYRRVHKATPGAGMEDSADIQAVVGIDRAGRDVLDEWGMHMEGFVPELLLTLPLAPRTSEFFYEDVSKGETVLIRGGFFAAAAQETSDMDFSIVDPKGTVIFERTDKTEGLFHFTASTPGTYTFILSNHRFMEEKMVTFAVGKGDEFRLKREHLDTMEWYAREIERNLIDIQTESTYLWIRQKAHMTAVNNVRARVLAFCLVEFLVLLCISTFQVYFIKGLLSNRRIL